MNLDPSHAYFWKGTWSNGFRLVVQDGINGRMLYNVGLTVSDLGTTRRPGTTRIRTLRISAPTTVRSARKTAHGRARSIATSGSAGARNRSRWAARFSRNSVACGEFLVQE